MIGRYWKYVTPAVILVMIFGTMLMDKSAVRSIINLFGNEKLSFAEKVDSAQAMHKEQFPKRTELIDLSGGVQRALGKRIVGDFEYIKDDQGMMQGTKVIYQDGITQFAESMTDLNDVAETLEIPLVYLTFPERSKYFLPAQSSELEFYGVWSKRVSDILKGNRIDCIDFDEKMITDPDAPKIDEFYVKTDGHDATQGEFWMSGELVKHLASEYNIEFPNASTVFDINNYTINRYDFLGNFARSSGRYFAGIDQFEIYIPEFTTELKYENYTTGETKQGSFSEVMLNGYEKGDFSEMTYWITEFGHYPLPYYGYINALAPENAPSLLVICDSTYMSGFSYLALACKRSTVIDPRFFSKTEYLSSELATEHYDAIVVVGQGLPPLTVNSSLPDLPAKEMISSEEYGRWIADDGICMGVKYGGETWNYGKRNEEFGMAIPVQTDEVTVYLSGWAADFCTDQPFQDLYLEVGDALLKCDYGRQDLSLSQAYGKSSLSNCGFEITFPVKYLNDGQVTEISFVAVSADGQYLYDPVRYQIIYS